MGSYIQNYKQGPLIAQCTSCGLDLNGVTLFQIVSSAMIIFYFIFEGCVGGGGHLYAE